MISEDRQDAIVKVMVIKYDVTVDEAQEMVTTYINEKPEDIDDELSDEEAAELINEYTD